jgi:hypothetical protein
MLKFVFLLLETQAPTRRSMLTNVAASVTGKMEGNGTNQAGGHPLSVADNTVLPGFTFIGILLREM